MMMILRAALVVGFLTAGTHSFGALIHGNSALSALTQTPPDPPTPMANAITGFAPDQTIHTTVDAVSYLTIYGSFINVGSATVESNNCMYDASISYWDAGTVVIQVVSLGPPDLEFVSVEGRTILDDTITVTVTNPGPPAQTTTAPPSQPQPEEVP